MKTIGIIGGMSWESTETYYRIINTVVKEQVGGVASAKVILYSVNFAEISECQKSGDWNKSTQILADIAKKLEVAGADVIVICTNTMHKCCPGIAENINIPIMHIMDVTADAILAQGITKIGLLGTKFSMVQDFNKDVLKARGIEVLVPEKEEDLDFMQHCIFGELFFGNILPESKQNILRMIAEMKAKGAQGIILGCTEIGMIISQEDLDFPVFDTTIIHATRAAEFSITD